MDTARAVTCHCCGLRPRSRALLMAGPSKGHPSDCMLAAGACCCYTQTNGSSLLAKRAQDIFESDDCNPWLRTQIQSLSAESRRYPPSAMGVCFPRRGDTARVDASPQWGAESRSGYPSSVPNLQKRYADPTWPTEEPTEERRHVLRGCALNVQYLDWLALFIHHSYSYVRLRTGPPFEGGICPATASCKCTASNSPALA